MRCGRILWAAPIILLFWIGPLEAPTTPDITVCTEDLPKVSREQDHFTRWPEPRAYLKTKERTLKWCNGKLGCYKYRLNFIIYSGQRCVLSHIRDHWMYGPLEETT